MNTITLSDKAKVKWQFRGHTRTGTVCYYPDGGEQKGSPRYTGNPELFILQDSSVLSGDGTREQRLAERTRFHASCTDIEHGDIILIDGQSFTLKFLGNYSDAFHSTRN